jgi:hypothetical protein
MVHGYWVTNDWFGRVLSLNPVLQSPIAIVETLSALSMLKAHGSEISWAKISTKVCKLRLTRRLVLLWQGQHHGFPHSALPISTITDLFVIMGINFLAVTD